MAGQVRSKAKGLMNMMYTSAELAEALGVDRRALLDRWIKEGLPYTQDAKRRYWFNGRDVAAWVVAYKTPRVQSLDMPKGMAMCLSCRQPVRIKDPQESTVKRTRIVNGTCPNCGGPVNRISGRKGAAW
jgi:hypothetical protein